MRQQLSMTSSLESNYMQSTIMSVVEKTLMRCKFLSYTLLLLASATFSINSLASTKVAFIGDQGMGSASLAVLSLIADEGAEMLMIQGDLAYADNSAMQWDANITNTLGRDFPVLTVVGNHENFEWPLYQRLIQQRIDRASGLSCTGDTGVKANCRYGNLQVVQVAPAIYEVGGVKAVDDYPGFLQSSFAGSDAPWRICAWHKTMGAMQTSYKGDSTGWGVFDACLDAGAMIAMAHAHTYSRTYLLSDYRTQTVAHRNSLMTLEPGRSFAFVSGLGGRDIREQGSSGDWFASIYTSAQGATYGALFCDFEETTADCYFKAIDGSVPDQFRLRTRGAISPPPEQPQADAPTNTGSERIGTKPEGNARAPGVFSRTDKQEYWWIERASNGQLAKTWISKACAGNLGVRYKGDWNELQSLAPKVASGSNPCLNNTGGDRPAVESSDGVVFSRTDKTEYRWITPDASGSLGSIWISKSCADRKGGATAFGDWFELLEFAPGFDTVANPC